MGHIDCRNTASMVVSAKIQQKTADSEVRQRYEQER